MTRYEIVAHVAMEIEATTPEAASAVFWRDLLADAGNTVALRGLAVWRSPAGPASGPLPPSVQRQLADFFAGVARCAAVEEAAFRARVEDILADTVAGSDDAAVAPQGAAVRELARPDGAADGLRPGE